jgi:glycosyltransferase involved in cell wall biosynthesis
VDRRGKIDLLRGADVLSVPATFREPKGFYVLEALAAGTPVVVPDHGSLPELVELTGGGMLFRAGSAADLARALLELADHPERAREMGEAGRRSLAGTFTDEAMAAATLDLYRRARGIA